MYSDYLDILEYQPSSTDYRTSEDLLKSEPCQAIAQFLKENLRDETHICVSLSGGVDSMVIIACLRRLTQLEIVGAHVEYGNRGESPKEAEFVEKWCRDNDIIFEKESTCEYKRDQMKRNDYEEFSRQLRFGLYGRVMKKYQCRGICLGHHAGDIAENVFTNVMHGRDLLDLEVIKPVTHQQGINFWRPLISCYKQSIFDFAHKYQIPYFKDTTPNWSNRGVLRRQIFPKCKERYGDFQRNLVSIGQQSSQWGEMIMSHIIEPFFQNCVQIGKMGALIKFKGHEQSPLSFWSLILKKILHKLGCNMISHKSMANFLVVLGSEKRNCQVTLHKTITGYLTPSTLILIPKYLLQMPSMKEEIIFDSESENLDLLKLDHCPFEVHLQKVPNDIGGQLARESHYIEGEISYYLPNSSGLILSNRLSDFDDLTKRQVDQLSPFLVQTLPLVGFKRNCPNSRCDGYLKVTIKLKP